MDYKKLYTRPYALEESKKTKDELEWSHFEFPKTVLDYYAIEHIDVGSTYPFPVAITAGSKVVICETERSLPEQVISRFQKKAYGAKFRGDGKLLAVGTEENEIKLFDYRKKTLLRTFTGHTCPVHRVDFMAGRPELVSFSDDKYITIWDIGAEQMKHTFTGHMSEIRAGAASTVSENVVVSGSYDQTVKIWDTRAASCVKTYNHGSRVQALLFFPNGMRIASAGEEDVNIFDLVANKPLKKFSNHHKTVTSLAFIPKTNTLLSGSMDKHVKIYNMTKMKHVHTLSDYSAQILSIGITHTASTLVVGMSAGDSGLISFQHENREKRASMMTEEKNKTKLYKYDNNQKTKVNKKNAAEGTSQFVKSEAHLKNFDYTACLNAICHKEAASQPENVIAIFHKLIQQDALKRVMPLAAGNVMVFTAEFTITYFMTPNYSRIVRKMADILIDLYENSSDDKTYGTFITKLKKECKKSNRDECLIDLKIIDMIKITKRRKRSEPQAIMLQEKGLPQTTPKATKKRKAVFNVPE